MQPSSMEDMDLMTAVRQGDIDRLGDLFELHHRHLYNFFLKQTGDRNASEDLVQDVFFRMLKYRHSYRAEGKFTTWMFSIAHRTRIDYYRRKRAHTVPLENAVDLRDPNPGPGELAEAERQKQLLKRALLALPEDKREVLILNRFEGKTYEEIAEITGSRTGTVKARAHRAIRELGRIVREMEELP